MYHIEQPNPVPGVFGACVGTASSLTPSSGRAFGHADAYTALRAAASAGFHEIWHCMVIAGAASHYALMYIVLNYAHNTLA